MTAFKSAVSLQRHVKLESEAPWKTYRSIELEIAPLSHEKNYPDSSSVVTNTRIHSDMEADLYISTFIFFCLHLLPWSSYLVERLNT